VIFFVSAGSVASEHCIREINLALDCQREILPIFLEDVELSPFLKISLTGIQAIYKFRLTAREYADKLENALHLDAAVGDVASTSHLEGRRHISRGGRRRWVLGIGLGAAAALALGVSYLILGPSAGERLHNGVVALGQFELLVDDAEARRFRGGMDNTLRRGLAASGMKTLARTARGTEEAEFAISGSIDRSDSQYLVTVSINDTIQQLTLWSAQLTRGIDETVEFRSEIAALVPGVLRCGLAARGSGGAREMSTRLLGLFVQFCDRLMYREDWWRAHELAQQIVATAPDLAIAQGAFAVSNAFLGLFNAVSPAEKEALFRTARTASARALELDPNTGSAHLALATSVPPGPLHWAERESHLRKIGSGDMMYSVALTSLVRIARNAGRADEAIELSRRAVARDPFVPYHTALLAYLLAMRGELLKADKLLERADVLWPHSSSAADYRWQIAEWYRAPDEAERALEDNAELLGMTAPAMACGKAFIEARRERTPVRVEAVRTLCRGNYNQSERMLASLGDTDGAWRIIERIDFSEWGSTIILFFPEMHAVRRDPRFMTLVKRIGLVDHWQTTGRWPDFCAEPDLPYDCKAVAESL
jgi:tetratricopeptide (TPR) repeat protein